MAVAPTIKDQIFDTLPGTATGLCRELMARYENLPLVVPVTAALATLSGAIGSSLRLDPGLAPQPLSSGLLVLLRHYPGSLASQAVEHLLAPLRTIQQDLFAGLAERNPKLLRDGLERILRERDTYLQNTPFPEPATMAEFDQEITRLRSILYPIILCENQPERLCRAFQRSLDGSVFVASTEPEQTKAWLQHWQSPTGRITRELAEAAATGRPFTTLLLDHPRKGALASPLLSAMMVGDLQTVQQWMTGPPMATLVEAPSFMAVEAGGSDVRLAPGHSGPLEQAPAWDALIRRLFAARLLGSRRVVTLTREVSEYLVQVVNGLTDDRLRQSENAAADLQRTLRQTLIVMLLLHACEPDPSQPVEMHTAHGAAVLSSWLYRQQVALKQKLGAVDPLEMFVREWVMREPNSRVTLREVYLACEEYFLENGLPPPRFLGFERRIAPLMRAYLSVTPSHCIKDKDGKFQRGWVYVALRSGPVEPIRWETA